MTRLLFFGIAYLASAGAGAGLAITGDLPVGFPGLKSTGDLADRSDTLSSFLGGWGTALSPPLTPLIVLGAALLAVMLLKRILRIIALVALVGLGIAFAVGQLGEPITRDVFSPDTFDAAKAAVSAGNVVLPAGMALSALRLLRR